MENDIQHVLGRKVAYPRTYSPEILVRVPRCENRINHGINTQELPFVGLDLWNCYEVSALLNNGAPVNYIVRILYPCESQYIVESKSLKLYLNAFNMTKCGDNAPSVKQHLATTISRDLSILLEIEVKTAINSPGELSHILHSAPAGEWEYWGCNYLTPVPLTSYTQDIDLLQSSGENGVLQGMTDMLRSRCKITAQPDWGDLYLYMDSDTLPTIDSLLRYIVSFRDENHFHEEVVEMIYQALWSRFSPRKLLVMAFYTRRGGIDINPARANHVALIEKYCPHLTNFQNIAIKSPRQ